MSDKDKKEEGNDMGKQPRDIEMPPFPFQDSESGTRSVINKSHDDGLDQEQKKKLRDALQNFMIAS